MTRAEFLGNIFECDPEDILHPIQEPTPACRYEACKCTSCEGCESDPSYWNAEITYDDVSHMLTSISRAYMAIVGMDDGNYEKVDKKNIYHTCGRCKFEYSQEDDYPCNMCAYGTDPRLDLWEAKEDD